MVVEKREDGFYFSSQQGVCRPIAYLELGEVEVADHVHFNDVCRQDYTPVGEHILLIRS